MTRAHADRREIHVANRQPPLFAYNPQHRGLVVFSPDGKPLGIVPCESLAHHWRGCSPSDLKTALPEWPPDAPRIALAHG